jgi:hypothetical protein
MCQKLVELLNRLIKNPLPKVSPNSREWGYFEFDRTPELQ